MPDPDAPLPEDVELELSRISKQAAETLLGKNQAEAQAQQAAAQQADPLTQIQQAELQMKQQELQHKMQMDKEKLEIDKASKMANMEHQQRRLEQESERAYDSMKSKERVEGAKLGVKVAVESDKNKTTLKKEGAKLGIEATKQLISENPMAKPTVNDLDKRLTVLEGVLEERWLETINRIKRLEAVIIGAAGTIILVLLTQTIGG